MSWLPCGDPRTVLYLPAPAAVPAAVPDGTAFVDRLRYLLHRRLDVQARAEVKERPLPSPPVVPSRPDVAPARTDGRTDGRDRTDGTGRGRDRTGRRFHPLRAAVAAAITWQAWQTGADADQSFRVLT